MELSEKIETINRRLVETFGIDTASSKPMYRVVWANDQYEYRFGTWQDFDKNDTLIREVTEARYVPKYLNSKGFYVLENLVGVPEHQIQELCGLKVSYEPLWTFKKNGREFVAPKFDICKLIIDTRHEAMKKNGYVRYVDDKVKQAVTDPRGYHREKIQLLMAEMFGNETPLTDALARKSGVGYTGDASKPKVTLN